MKIEILGTGCAKCTTQEKIVKEALSQLGGFHQVIKVEDIMEIMKYNVASTPAIVVDGVVKSSGKLLSLNEVIKILNKN